MRSEYVQLVGQWRPSHGDAAVDVDLLLRRVGRALQDAQGQELGADEREFRSPLEKHEAHVTVGQVVVLTCAAWPTSLQQR